MGFSPDEIGDMSLWQFTATLEGWRVANGASPNIQPPSAEEYYAWTEGRPINGRD